MSRIRINTLLLSIFAIVLALAATPGSFAQNANSGEIKGTVTDSSNAVISGATVSIHNVQTGVVMNTVTNGAGIYDVPSVPLGQYSITFSKPGFKDYVRDGITLQLTTLGIDAALQVGAPTERVVVTAAAPLLQNRGCQPEHQLRHQADSGCPYRRRHLVQRAHQ